MTELTLRGCRTTPLGGYLAALGLLRAITRLLDGEATGRWERQRFVLGSRFGTLDELVDELLTRFEPEAIVSPWNAGSGFAGNGKNVTAERALEAVRQSDNPRLTHLKEAVYAGDRIVARGRELGWGGKGDDLWDKAHKPDVLGLCRNEFPDHALPWLDAAVALGQDDDPAYSRLLGTGGNFGRQDLSATYLARLQSVLTDRRSRDWLHSLLSGEESTPYLRDAVGQFDPGRAGGIQSSPLEKSDDKGFVNPWAFLLTVEGTLLFATAVVRRHGANYARVALPFQVRGSAAGTRRRRRGRTCWPSCGHRNGPPRLGWTRSRTCSRRGVPSGTTGRPAPDSISPERSPPSGSTGASRPSSGTCSSTGTARTRSRCRPAGSRFVAGRG